MNIKSLEVLPNDGLLLYTEDGRTITYEKRRVAGWCWQEVGGRLSPDEEMTLLRLMRSLAASGAIRAEIFALGK